MSGSWLRYGDFFQKQERDELRDKIGLPHILRMVSYINEAVTPIPIVRALDVTQTKDKVSFDFFLTPFNYASFAVAVDAVEFKISGVSQQTTTDEFLRANEYMAEFVIDTEQHDDNLGASALIQLLQMLDDFSPEFIQELTELTHANPKGQHIIPLANARQAQVDPTKSSNRELYFTLHDMILEDQLYRDHYEKLKLLLTQGYDPNQNSESNIYPFYLALELKTEILELLLCYGANPFLINSGGTGQHSYSLIEEAKRRDEINHLNTISKMFTRRVEKPLQVERPLQVIALGLSARQNQLVTKYKFEDGIVFTTLLKNLDALKKEEKEELYRVYKTCFKDPNNDEKKLEDNFYSSFATKKFTKLVNVIYSHEPDGTCRIVGAVLIELIKLEKMPDIFAIHIEYAFLHRKYRGHLNMALELYKVAYAILLLTAPGSVVPIFGSYVDYDGYKMVSRMGVVHTPKYSSSFADELLADILSVASGDGVTVHRKPPTWAVQEKDPVEVIPDEVTKTYSDKAHTKLFRVDLAGSFKNVYVPVLFFANESWQEMHDVAKRIGIDFTAYIAKFAKLLVKTGLLKTFVGQDILVTKFPFYSLRSNHLFFTGKSLAANETMQQRMIRGPQSNL